MHARTHAALAEWSGLGPEWESSAERGGRERGGRERGGREREGESAREGEIKRRSRRR
jgi:hypothetical protein